MEQAWEQPIRPLEYAYLESGTMSGWSDYRPVLFIRARANGGYEVMGLSGSVWAKGDVLLRFAEEA